MAHRRDAPWIGSVLIVITAALLTVRAVFSDGLLTWRFRLGLSPYSNPTEIAFRYERDHPGEVFFPWNTTAALMASGKLYHFDYAAHDRIIAGYAPDDHEVHACLPPNMRAIAYPPEVVPSMQMLMLLPEYDQPIKIRGLPQFLIYGKKESK